MNLINITREDIMSSPNIYIQKFIFSISYHSMDVYGRKLKHTEHGQIIRISDYGIRFTSGLGAISIHWGYIDDITILNKLPVLRQKCPVCNGRGLIPNGFYQSISDTYVSSGGTEVCRSCNGKGYIESIEF